MNDIVLHNVTRYRLVQSDITFAQFFADVGYGTEHPGSSAAAGMHPEL